MQIKTNKIVSLLVSLFFIISCGSSKKDLQLENAFKKYLSTRNIQYEKNDTIYSKYYSDFLNDETKNLIMKNPNLKTNKVYVYQGGSKVITFCVYADNGELYVAETNKNGSAFLTEPENGKIQIKRRLELIFLGAFKLENNTIKNTRYEKTPRKEWYDCNVGIVKQDTITIVEDYRTNKYGSYKKKWLTKTLKTNYNLIYQPDLKATKFKNEFGFDSYFIEGSFNFERDLKEEKMLELINSRKY